MRIVTVLDTCDECGEEFEAKFIEHEAPEDDFEWEEDFYEESPYPHTHFQPNVECHICPKCRNH